MYMEHGGISFEMILEKKILKLNIIMMKNRKNFHFLSGCTSGLPAISWPQKRECRLEICCSVLVCVCVWHTRLIREK